MNRREVKIWRSMLKGERYLLATWVFHENVQIATQDTENQLLLWMESILCRQEERQRFLPLRKSAVQSVVLTRFQILLQPFDAVNWLLV